MEYNYDYNYDLFTMTVEDHTFWIAKSTTLNGCVGQGDTRKEAIKELRKNEKEWIKTALEVGIIK